jgi:response regulator RpfG family c-di-GMP phosphodiesterase
MGLELGAADYITKPISPPIVLARVKTQLLLKGARDFLRDQNAFLEAEVARRTAEKVVQQQRILRAIGSVADDIVAAGEGLEVQPGAADTLIKLAQQIRTIIASS